MTRLPTLSGTRTVHNFERFGRKVVRRGSHIIMTKSGNIATLSVPTFRPSPEVPCAVSYAQRV